MTSLRETGEKILLPYPITQPARTREFLHLRSLPERMLILFRITFDLPYTTIGIRNCALNRLGEVLIWTVGKFLSVQR